MSDPITTAAALLAAACGLNCLMPDYSDQAVAKDQAATRAAWRQVRMQRTARWREWYDNQSKAIKDEGKDFMIRNSLENRAIEQWVRTWRFQYPQRMGRVPIKDRTAVTNFKGPEDLAQREAAIVAGAAERGEKLAPGSAIHPQLLRSAEGMMAWSPIAKDEPLVIEKSEWTETPTADANELRSGGLPPAHVQRKDFVVVCKAPLK